MDKLAALIVFENGRNRLVEEAGELARYVSGDMKGTGYWGLGISEDQMKIGSVSATIRFLLSDKGCAATPRKVEMTPEEREREWPEG